MSVDSKAADAEPVARDEKALTAAIPDGEGKHAAQVLHTVCAIFLVKDGHCFSITVGAILVTARLQLFAQLGMVVDFTVENDPDCSIFVAERLVSVARSTMLRRRMPIPTGPAV